MRTKKITGFDAYRIREDGVLETNWRTGAHYPGMKCDDKWKALSIRYNDKGYVPICLRGECGKERRTHLHRLVAESFIGDSPFPKACVRHLDGNSKNNCIENLAWGTYQENENDKLRHGTHGKRISNGKLTVEAMGNIRDMIGDGMTMDAVAKIIGVSRPTISRFLNGRTWK